MARKKQTKEGGKMQTGCWFYESADKVKTYYCSCRSGGKNITVKIGTSTEVAEIVNNPNTEKGEKWTLEKAGRYRGKLKSGDVKTPQQVRIEDKEAEARNIEALYKLYVVEKDRGLKDKSLFDLYVEKYYGKKDIQACTNKDPEGHYEWLLKQPGRNGTGLSPQSIKHAMGLFRRIYLHSAKKERLVIKISHFSMPVVNNTVTEYLEDDVLREYIHVLKTDKVNRPVADAMLFSLCTGMRMGEILALRWTDVDRNKKIIKLRNTKSAKLKGYKKDEVVLEIPLNSDAEAILFRQRKRSMVIFANKHGEQRYCITKQATRLRNKAGLGKDFRPFHALRHVYATKSYEAGTDIKVISKMLGHSSVTITERYVEVSDNSKQEAAALMNIVGIGGKK